MALSSFVRQVAAGRESFGLSGFLAARLDVLGRSATTPGPLGRRSRLPLKLIWLSSIRRSQVERRPAPMMSSNHPLSAALRQLSLLMAVPSRCTVPPNSNDRGLCTRRSR